ncbi:MAG: autotransporter-associated beta strand repeat-containing protein [Chthoniobacterales bacterium]|nr:autotransporter-associated beta strand repeat-containing protein [Chthoniobacterales bacterium]
MKLNRATRLVLLLAPSLFTVASGHAGSATWSLNPSSSDWNTETNWTPESVPNGPEDTATFDVSNQAVVRFTTGISVAAIVFNPGVGSYSITTRYNLDFFGNGIVNESSVTQNFRAGDVAGSFNFHNNATAGNVHFFTSVGGVVFYDTASAANATIDNLQGIVPGITFFHNSSTAGNAMILNHAGSPNGGGTLFMDTSTAGTATFISEGAGSGNSGVQFRDNSSADHGTFTAEGGGIQEAGNLVTFSDSATAANAAITANGGAHFKAPGGLIIFYGRATAANATLTANSGTNRGGPAIISFSDRSRGGTARVVLHGGLLDLSFEAAPGLSLGSIEGAGYVSLGPNNLTVGKNGLNTVFSGTIKDDPSSGGSLTKEGLGALVLSGASTFTGGTIVVEGTLSVRNKIGSATGTGGVSIPAGHLAGDGIIAGAVVVGTGTISPGPNLIAPGTLTLQSGVTLNSGSTYQFNLQSDNGTAASLSSSGVIIDGSAMFIANDSGNTALAPGVSLVVIQNTSAAPISGVFSNLPDGGTITIGNNTFLASYEGGDGNDLTLTVQ